MAIFHLTAKVISRGKGQSAIAAAAYRSGERLRDEQANEQKLYETRAERIQFTAIMAPKDAPEWAYDRNQLWNEAERAEKRKDAQLAREIEIALPHEMTDEQRQWLAKDFAREAFVRHGYAVDIAIHAPDPTSDSRNYHAHLMITMRTLDADGFAAKKDPAMNSRAQLGQWREQFAHLANRHLERHGIEARIDHRSLEAQGIDREPTVHVGYAGMEMAARGAQSDRMDALKEILERNELRFEIKALDGELKALEAAQAQHEPAMRDPAPRPFGDAVRDEGQQARQERHDEKFRADQAAWRESVNDRQPGKTSISGKGFEVVDGATGAVSNLGDFMLGLMAGSSGRAQPEQAPAPSMQEFLNNPAARAAHQRAGAAKAIEEREDILALHRIGQDVLNGRKLKAEDIQSLTHEHQQSIHLRGDDRIRELVEEARKRARDDGRERE